MPPGWRSWSTSIRPHEVYNLAAQSHVRVSFDEPAYTAQATGVSTLNLLEAIRTHRHVDPLLPGAHERDVRCEPAAAERGHALLPAQPLRRREGLLVLDHQELPRGVRHVRGQRPAVQPRVAAPRRDLRDAQDHPRRSPTSSRACRPSSGWATSTRSATGATPRSTPTACGGCCRPTSRRTSSSRRAPRTRSATSSTFAFEHAGLEWEDYVKFDPKFLRPTEVDELIGDAGKAKAKLGWEAKVLPPELARIMVDADIARLEGAKEGQF